ncbi:hypothetical protein [Paraburkholderia sp. HD33-4]|uniref:hypothetical protein n=1 Tax=Paraburkholderia sp. HD33-4 TaxID=2883242 RepID=UPI001F4769AA|nr:hypothetical protein [Paraburkholderia sp. HD33-4]
MFIFDATAQRIVAVRHPFPFDNRPEFEMDILGEAFACEHDFSGRSWKDDVQDGPLF